jgi:hypothetical protein
MTQKKLFFFFLIIFIGVLGVGNVHAVSLYGQLDHSTCVEPLDGQGLHTYTTNGMSGHVDKVCFYGSVDVWAGMDLYRQNSDYQNGAHVSGQQTVFNATSSAFLPDSGTYYSGGNGASVNGFHELEQWICVATDFDLDPAYYYKLDTWANLSWCGSTSSSAYETASYDTFAYPYGGQFAVKDLAWSFGDPTPPPASISMVFPANNATTTDFSTWQAEFNVAEVGSGTVEIKYGLSGYTPYTDTVSYYVLDNQTAPINIPKSRLLSPDTYNVYAILKDGNGSTLDTSELNYFEVQSGAYFNNNYYEPPPTGTSTPTVTCDPESGFFNESICKMMTYLFTPDPNKYNELVGLKDELNEKAPFAYFNLAKALFEDVEIQTGDYPEASLEMNLFGSTPTNVPLVAFESDFVSKDDFSQVRSAFAYVLWLMFLSYLFVRPLELLTNKK